MARFAGNVGFVKFEETAPGVASSVPTERLYYGDVLQDMQKWGPTDSINDDMQIQNRISIVADPYAFENFFSIKYVYWMGQRWKATSVEVKSPRLIIHLGGLYNGA